MNSGGPSSRQGATAQRRQVSIRGPNLLVNPGAEAGDPSLSGYGAVTVPGWAQTGTPTVIKYGTLRRFPVPTLVSGTGTARPSGISKRAGHSRARRGERFFGGGPVADSTLTQTVDLRASQADDRRRRGYIPMERRSRRHPDRPVKVEGHRRVPRRERNQVGDGNTEADHRMGSLVLHRFHSSRRLGRIPALNTEGRRWWWRSMTEIRYSATTTTPTPTTSRSRSRSQPHPCDARAAGLERRRARSRVHGVPREQGRQADSRQSQRAVHQQPDQHLRIRVELLRGDSPQRPELLSDHRRVGLRLQLQLSVQLLPRRHA